MSLAPAGGTAAAEAAEPQGTPAASSVDLAIVGRSPGQLAWARLRRDKVAMVSGTVMLILIVIALAAPLIEKLYGVGPNDFFKDDLDRYGMPYGVAGGISGTHWFGLEPGKGSDIFINLVYGMRTSLLIAFTAALITTVIGVVIGILAGYLGGWVDAVLGWVTDLFLALPFLIFTLTLVRPLELHFYGPRDAVPSWFRITILIGLFAVFGWTSTARLVRGQVISLREREFVEAARAAGAGLGHMLFQQLLPNIWAPILVSFSLAVPSYITGEAALSFLGIGVVEPIPDFGRMIFRSLSYLQTDPAYVFFPGITIFILVLAFNLFGDALRDALDPKSAR